MQKHPSYLPSAPACIDSKTDEMAPTPYADAMTWGGRRSSTAPHPTSVMATTTPRSVIPPLRHAMTAPRAWHLFVKVCTYRFCGKDGTDALRRCHDVGRAQIIDRTTPLSLMATTTPRSVISPLRHAMTAPRAWHLFVKVCPYRFCGKDGTDALRRCHDVGRAQVIDRTTPLSLMSLR